MKTKMLEAVNRKIFVASKTILDQKNDTKITDPEFTTINKEFMEQQKSFHVLIMSLYTHLQHCRSAPQTLVDISNAMLKFVDPENDIFNYVLQFKTACQIRQMSEEEYTNSYEILYSNAHSCVTQYLELEERKKVLSDRFIDYNLAKTRVLEMKKKKNPKGLEDLINKETVAQMKYNLLKEELIKDMCLMVNMVVKYRGTMFRAIVELELKRRDGVNEALYSVKKLGGENGAIPEFVITDASNSFVNDKKCFDNFERNEQHNEQIVKQKEKTEKLAKEKERVENIKKNPPTKTIPRVSSNQMLMSEEMKLKNEIIKGIQKEIKTESESKNKADLKSKEKVSYQVFEETKKENKTITQNEVKKEVNENPFEKLERKTAEEIQSDTKEEKNNEVLQEQIEPKVEKKEEVLLIKENKKNEEAPKEVNLAHVAMPNELSLENQQTVLNEPSNEKSQEETQPIEKKQELPVEIDEERVEAQVEVQEEVKSEDTKIDKEAEEIKSEPKTIPTPTKPIIKMRALYDYEATDDTELSLNEGDIIDIYDNSGDWWLAELNGKRGLVPANFIDYVK
ncbi:proline-serine-threonine phosphatase interacting protein, putative [Entamoeba invadens IP1]|uniref:Proline-serine-threonine phosphatase interacting protein, putative n=1 Tax=Entamoeba invadens IP1 TaxID=370355 RepID=A0A0A1TZU5_ENTIV|nr:proline-serine-threonine phosphatase interacting protein, putative [Entamoeba invadens IP1]ELP87121.1 proline-serine-threonine phosphatase interacting protein, putative [Entamoeba invadens IP1]|eukprot:XP_004253892.1 proline-serine-threonine phosphatase interacting protein, putative [Entamoeba invadens IP1]